MENSPNPELAPLPPLTNSNIGGEEAGRDSLSAKDSIELALDHTWSWFSLHASQRLQSVNFFLVAIAFLSNAFVTAIKEHLYLIAAGVSVLAISTSFFLYKMERRIRSLIHSSEHALSSLQNTLSNALGLPSIKIVSAVENAGPGEWKYSRVFRYLYGVTAFAFALGFVYAVVARSGEPTMEGSDRPSVDMRGALLVVVGAYLTTSGARPETWGTPAARKSASVVNLVAGASLLTLGASMVAEKFLRLN